MIFLLLTATDIIFLRFLTTESADCPAPWGKTACPAHTQRIARFLEDFYVCLRTTQHINLDSWTEKTWLASCCIQKYLKGQLLQPSSVHDKCRNCFSTKNSHGKSILQTFYHCCLVTRNDSKWHPSKLIYSIQTKHTVKLKIPSGLGNHIQLSFTYHPLISPSSPKYIWPSAGSTRQRACHLPSSNPWSQPAKLVSRHISCTHDGSIWLILFTCMFGWFLGFSCRKNIPLTWMVRV